MPRKKKKPAPVRVYKRRVVVDVYALEGFLRHFRPEWISLMSEMCEYAAWQDETPFNEDHYFDTDEATDYLWDLFGPKDPPEHRLPAAPAVTYDPDRGELTIHEAIFPDEPREPREGELPGPVKPFNLDLSRAPNTQN